jgi:hypothetical protein
VVEIDHKSSLSVLQLSVPAANAARPPSTFPAGRLRDE